MSEEIKKEMTDEELDNVAGAGKLEDLEQAIIDHPDWEIKIIRAAQQGGKSACILEIINFCQACGYTKLSYLANDVIGIIDTRWMNKGYFEGYSLRGPKNFI